MMSPLPFRLLVAALLVFGAQACSRSDAARTPADAAPRVVSLGGHVTETMYALGLDSLLVGTDASSTYPAAARQLAQVGYYRQVGAEGVLSLRPSMVLAANGAGPDDALVKIRDSGVQLVQFGAATHPDSTVAHVLRLANLFGVPQRGQALADTIRADMAAARSAAESRAASPRVLFVMARGNNAVMVAGTNTAADAMIRLAGGTNVVTGFAQYKPLTPEAAPALDPDFLLLTTTGLQSLGGTDGLTQLPGLGRMRAVREGRLIVMDDGYLLNFGPRLGKAVAELARALSAPAPAAAPLSTR